MRRWQLLHTLLICILSQHTHCEPVANTQQNCRDVLQQHLDQRVKEARPFNSRNILYFLHIPRTAGRTFHSCLLKLGTPPSQRCPRSYDFLRVDNTTPNCTLLSSHDDFSVVDLLSGDVTVVTQLRDPVDRVISAYEFAIEVAARAFARKKVKRTSSRKVATETVWPWSHLVPFFVADIARRQQQRTGNLTSTAAVNSNRLVQNSFGQARSIQAGQGTPQLDPYSNSLVMSLAEFVEQPIVTELLHEGGMLQVLGLTNYSRYEEAGQLRRCMLEDPGIHDQLLDRALQRLETFSHVGATDLLRESVMSAAASVQRPLSGPSYTNSEATYPKQRRQVQQVQHQMQPERRGVERQMALGPAYAKCTNYAQARNQRRRNRSLAALRTPDGQELKFSKEARKMIPAEVIKAILDRNKGDKALYKKATQLLWSKLAEHKKLGLLERVPFR